MKKVTKSIATLATVGLLLCGLGAYLSGCASEIASADGFVRVRNESFDPTTGNLNPALYQRKDALGAGKPTYILKLDGQYHPLRSQIETD